MSVLTDEFSGQVGIGVVSITGSALAGQLAASVDGLSQGPSVDNIIDNTLG